MSSSNTTASAPAPTSTSTGTNFYDPDSTDFYDPTTDFADLGRERYDHDTAAIGDRDSALYTSGPITMHQGRAPAGKESQVFAWSAFQYATEDKDEREELKGDLHGGQLHRLNKAARGETVVQSGGARGGRAGGREERGAADEGLVAGRKGAEGMPPLAMGRAEELGEELFWDGKIC